MKILRCRDLGFDCDAVVRADTDAEVLAGVAEHAQQAHNLQVISEEVILKVQDATQEEE